MTTDRAHEFVIERSVLVDAPASTVHGFLDDLHRWTSWSPWEGSDPDLSRTYSGSESGVGASYAWSGNRKAGAGSMTIVESTDDRVVLDLRFTKPFKATNVTTFLLSSTGSGTEVTWRMTGQQNVLARLVGRIVPMEKFIGKDFEKGLGSLKVQAEQQDR
ncbi:SRPBCC family protein [Rhodococcus sp. BP-349]|uniref:SRPBCC family protein n=1 Tax=unclassified Rhodococcus (in: high G+C Gram-positive bacteria) TaxID=192944 RepID=UPI001C9AD27E|nr:MULTISPECIES: SRPBCC family protein [unclassified Rhodococcus (in: high G+C Gram-positive bacteria)]MBY6538621.1 SRPBCC family protein [Rhodococcus sp. BP-363]MBY6542958.1 SRPBCC family protein [Rhodococcus sp. BP-369]MBY6562188.1 SRPBCC family protein [Rhodococcus sp. BP-370]MBY6576480.1 SRPBCC family protein [Rhodococcus sp. BP-364]MBY6585781.1 SRPBCC family protein [Rhodococcus sp. BP-358]